MWIQSDTEQVEQERKYKMYTLEREGEREKTLGNLRLSQKHIWERG